MADFSLTTLFVVPSGSTIATAGSTQDLAAGQVGVFGTKANVAYSALAAGDMAAVPYFYVAQGRQNTYLQGSKRSDKIKGCVTGMTNCHLGNVTEWYKVIGCGTPVVQITDVSGFNVQCGDVVTVTLRAHSSYLDTLYFNGLTRSATVQAPCCQCGADPCVNVDVPALIDQLIAKFKQAAPGNNPDNMILTNFFDFQRVGTGAGAILRITGKPLTKYGVPCDIAAFPFEYDRMWFRTFVYEGPATTADYIVADACNIVANAAVVQRASYATGTPEEIRQLEKNYYSYQAGYLKHLYRMMGYNQNYESYVVDTVAAVPAVYDTYYIKFNEYFKGEYQWGDFIPTDEMVIIAAVKGSAEAAALDAILAAALGTPAVENVCLTTTSTTTVAGTTTTTTSTLFP
jgi:hypothetical protein